MNHLTSTELIQGGTGTVYTGRRDVPVQATAYPANAKQFPIPFHYTATIPRLADHKFEVNDEFAVQIDKLAKKIFIWDLVTMFMVTLEISADMSEILEVLLNGRALILTKADGAIIFEDAMKPDECRAATQEDIIAARKVKWYRIALATFHLDPLDPTKECAGTAFHPDVGLEMLAFPPGRYAYRLNGDDIVAKYKISNNFTPFCFGGNWVMGMIPGVFHASVLRLEPEPMPLQ